MFSFFQLRRLSVVSTSRGPSLATSGSFNDVTVRSRDIPFNVDVQGLELNVSAGCWVLSATANPMNSLNVC